MEWNKNKINSICKIVSSGGTPSRRKKEYYNGTIKWLKTKELNDANIYETEEHISEEALRNSSAKIYPKNTIVMAMYGATVGKLGIIKQPMSTNQACCCMVVDEKKADFRYLFYQLIYSRNKLISLANGAAQQNLNSQIIKNYEICIPPLPIQKKIVHILSTLDEKIELNRKMNETLEAMAQAIFKSWFVDFDPVHAKARTKTKADLETEAKKLGITPEILELFPSEFEESEVGMIPKGWEVKKFGTLLSKTIGGDWGKEELDHKHTEKVRIIRGTDIPKIKSLSIKDIPTRYVETKKLKNRELIDGDIIIEISGGTKNQPTGRTLYITNEILEMLNNKVEPASFCRLFRPINPEVGLILSQHMLHIYDIGKTWQYQNQSTGISNFQTTIFLENEKIILPDKKLQELFFKIVRPLIEKSLSKENIILQQTRDTLLPKLLSGELDVSEVEI